MPYSWDKDHDYDSSSTGGYSFHDARKSYDDVAVAQTGTKVIHTYKSPFLTTDAAYPLIIGIDTTGSMQEWPRTFFEKLPLLYRETVKYFPDCAISFQAINDFEADGEDVALQPAPFGRGEELDGLIGQLYPVGGGGGQSTESYEIFAAYNAFVQAPRAVIRPIAIILGDEAPFKTLPRKVAVHYGLSGKMQLKGLPARVAFERFHQACDAFLVRKPYGGSDRDIVKAWMDRGLFPAERILTINDPRRVVDVILGILGILTGKAELFEAELKERQDPGQVAEVMDSLHGLMASRHASMAQSSLNPGLGGPRSRGLDIDE